MANYRILSIDGGGVRGILTCVVLERLAEAVPDFLTKLDLFAGTSTGSVLALGLAAGYTPDRGTRLYGELAGEVFAPAVQNRLPAIGYALRPKYSNALLERVLAEQFGDLTLGELEKKVLVAAFNLDRNPFDPQRVRSWMPKFFNNFQQDDLEERGVDVALRSAAAPTYFPSHKGHVDGGVVANNPSVAAMAQALDPRTGSQKLEDVVLLSLGTGRVPEYMPQPDIRWGWLQWARPILPMMMDGSVAVAHYQASRFLGARYHRFDPILPRPIAVDDATALDELRRVGQEADLTATIEWLEHYF